MQKKPCPTRALIVYYGDILSSLNLKDLLAYHETKQASATVALSRGFNIRVGVVDLHEDSKIIGSVEKPTMEKPVSMEIMVLSGENLAYIEGLRRKNYEVDLMEDLIPHLIKEGTSVYGYLSDDFWHSARYM